MFPPIRVVATFLCLAVVSFAGCSATDDDSDLQTIEWSEADDHVGETVRVCGPVAGTAQDGDDTFLNLGADYPAEDRFVIVVWDQGDYEVPEGNQRACATGDVTEYEGVPQLEVRDTSDLEFTRVAAQRDASSADSSTTAGPNDAEDLDKFPAVVLCKQEIRPALTDFHSSTPTIKSLRRLQAAIVTSTEHGQVDLATVALPVVGAISLLENADGDDELNKAFDLFQRAVDALDTTCRAIATAQRLGTQVDNAL